MTPERSDWTEVDQYFSAVLLPPDAALAAALRSNVEARLPAIDVAPNQGKLLQLLVRISGARRVLEFGTLGGYSTIWLAGALPATDGWSRWSPSRARRGRPGEHRPRRFGRSRGDPVGPGAGFAGAARRGGHGAVRLRLHRRRQAEQPALFAWALRLTRPGSVIVVDNVVRDGQVIDGRSPDPKVQGVRAFLEMMGADPRLDATALQTVGAKGWDGFSIAAGAMTRGVPVTARP